MFRRVGAAGALLALASCTTTVDSVGYNGPGGVHLQPLKRLSAYPNPFHDELGKSDADIQSKIVATFTQLFYGNADQMIYYPTTPDQAYIQDVLHGDIRTEGIGLAMMITVELDKRMEFDRLWTYALTQMKQKDPPRAGYFQSSCDIVNSTEPCDDPYGEAQMVTALIFAHDRWTSTSGPVNYEAGAVDLLDVMRHKEDQNGGVVGGITDTFDSSTALPFSVPEIMSASAQVGRPSIVMPAYYDLWAQATGDPFWTRAAVAARAYWQRSANASTGLMPVRARFDGTPEAYYDRFAPEAYRAQINMTLDHIWSGTNDWVVDESNKLLLFFFPGIGMSYNLDGSAPMGPRDPALVVVTGVSAMIAMDTSRMQFMSAVWDLVLPTGMARYYSGILDLTALLIMSGQYRIW